MTCFCLFSISDLERMLGAVELLNEMLRAVNPNDKDVRTYMFDYILVYVTYLLCSKVHSI